MARNAEDAFVFRQKNGHRAVGGINTGEPMSQYLCCIPRQATDKKYETLMINSSYMTAALCTNVVIPPSCL